VHLAFDNHVIEHVAAVVDGRIADQRRRAGLRIDLDFRNMAAVRKSLRRVGSELGVQVLGNFAAPLAILGLRREVEQADAPVGAGYGERAAVVDDVGFRGRRIRDWNQGIRGSRPIGLQPFISPGMPPQSFSALASRRASTGNRR
jgi:hypothetical protein